MHGGDDVLDDFHFLHRGGRHPDVAVERTYILRTAVAKLVASDTVGPVPDKTLLAFAGHGSFDALLDVDDAGAQGAIAAVASAGVDVEVLAQSLQRQGAKAFGANWAALVDAIAFKVAPMEAWPAGFLPIAEGRGGACACRHGSNFLKPRRVEDGVGVSGGEPEMASEAGWAAPWLSHAGAK